MSTTLRSLLALSSILVLMAPTPSDAAGVSVRPLSGASVVSTRLVQVSPGGKRLGRGPDAPSANGTQNLPFTVARAHPNPFTVYDPEYLPVGRLVIDYGTKAGLCTATLIRPSVVLTAAHCLEPFGTGGKGAAKAVEFTPGLWSGAPKASPYGTFKGSVFVVPKPWTLGTDTADVNGSRNNDVALVVLQKKDGKRAGDLAGTIKVGFNGAGFVPRWSQKIAQVTVLGYPSNLDGGNRMIRLDAPAAVNAWSNAINYQFGSNMGGGASGGPIIINFGAPPTLTGTAEYGEPAQAQQMVVGVYQATWPGKSSHEGRGTYLGINKEVPNLSYGPYLGGNIGALLQKACTLPGFADAC
jgi:V8-like Glu-specific endopeptidase